MNNRKPTFAGTEGQQHHFESASIILQSIPYDGTSTWGKGADRGFGAFMKASEHMETYDIETGTEVYKQGIYVTDPVTEDSSPEAMVEAVCQSTRELLNTGKFLTFFGGEHSISIGIMRAFREVHPDLSVLQLDAHTDLRPEFEGSAYNHACALHEISKHCNLVQVGIRSMDASELPFLNKEQCYLASDMQRNNDWMEESISQLSDKVYITLDLDVFDPSVMPSTGTPEPGGMHWYTVIQYLKKVFRQKEVIGFDIVELAPIDDLKGPDFLASKLYYKMLTYKFANQ